MSRLTRDGTAEPVSRDQILKRERGQGNIHFPSSADHEQGWQPYPVDSYSAICVTIHIHIFGGGGCFRGIRESVIGMAVKAQHQTQATS